MRLISLFVIVASVVAATAFAADIPKFDQSMLVSGSLLKEQRPEYPVEARRNRIQGSGVFILNISHQTGRVDSITIKKSTGHNILDAAAMKAFMTYRFKPGTPPKIWIPLDFNVR